MDSKRITLGYLFFMLGIYLTLYQYYHLIIGGPLEPFIRQFSIIILNTVAVYIGWLLVYPWHLRTQLVDDEEESVKDDWQHLRRMMWISLFFCFVTMVGIAYSLIDFQAPSKEATGVKPNDPIFLDRGSTENSGETGSDFKLGNYLIAGLYMMGYGVLGLGPRLVSWLIRFFHEPNQSPGPASAESSPRKPTKRQAYPIESVYMVGKIRKKAGGLKRRPAKDTAQD